MTLPPIDKMEWGIGVAAMLSGWGANWIVALWLALPIWAHLLLQGVYTISLGVITVIATHYVRRYLHKRAPIKGQEQGEIE